MQDKKLIFSILAFVASSAACTMQAQVEEVPEFQYSGPCPLTAPWMGDSLDVRGGKFNMTSVLQTPFKMQPSERGRRVTGGGLAPGSSSGYAIHRLAFTVENERRAKVTFHIGGLKHFALCIDGEPADSPQKPVTLLPSCHQVAIQYLTSKDWTDSLRVQVSAADGSPLKLSAADGKSKRAYDMYDVICVPGYNTVALSPDGRYLSAEKSWTDRSGTSHSQTEVREMPSGRLVGTWSERVAWMPRGGRLYAVRKVAEGHTQVVAVNPQTHEETVWADDIPEGWFEITPDEKSLVYTLASEGREKDPQVYDVKEPDDRQPGWRTRTNLARYDLSTGVLQPLTYGYRNVFLQDISADSRYVLFGRSESRLTKRPTTLTSYYRMNLATLAVDTLVEGDGFLSGARFSPDGRQVLLTGSPEALGGIGKDVDEGQVPSMIDNQLFLLDIDSRRVRPLTLHFNPNVTDAVWSRYDGKVYIKAEDKDRVSLFRLDPQKDTFVRLDVPEEYVNDFAVAASAPVMGVSGESASNADRLYRFDTKTMKAACIDDLHARELDGVQLGECRPWNWVNARGDTVCCRYYLPPHFDEAKKYPVVVNYYGGCSPTSRTFASRYPQHVYAAMGYIVLVVNPSGATGFGQRFSARHVATAGQGVADDIIGSTKAFLSEHAYADAGKVGCIGASYGGFMTQYLQTQTDLFAAAISHAGISDHTSYWGEGYWGYSYSEVSMADRYPWTDRHLYVDQSPLYHADKIHTPLLFLHGTADNNVPVGESIQLYTALKLLGRPTAMVLVDGQDHHIVDFQKRLKWQDTIFAWFAKWLQDDSSWWNELYGDEKM